jgi:hypothetical protein
METKILKSTDLLKVFETGENIALKYYLMRFGIMPQICKIHMKIDHKLFQEKMLSTFQDEIETTLDEQELDQETLLSEDKKCDYVLKNEVVVVSASPREVSIYYSEKSIAEKNAILQILNESKYIKPVEICFNMIVSADDLYLRKMGLDEKSDYDVNLLYNDDLFDELPKIDSFIKNDATGLMLLHGTPGTGKTNFIKELIRRHPEQSFIYIPNKLFAAIDSVNFVNFFIENKNSILIIEDAEALLVDREKGNFSISTLLNLTEGLLGEALKIKVICTFNCEIGKIDKALTRKGRLKFIYEFKPLKTVKVNELFKVLNVEHTSEKEMPISDIFHHCYNNGLIVEEKKTIGFK